VNRDGKFLRVRVAGVIIEDDKLLLIAHKKDGQVYWLLPGGGVDYGESLDEALIREFKEELNIAIDVKEMAFMCDSIDPHGDRHIVNLCFFSTISSRDFEIGDDPRLYDYKFFTKNELETLKIHPPVNKNLISILDGNLNDLYIGKVWLEK